jgi:hypothetical protein
MADCAGMTRDPLRVDSIYLPLHPICGDERAKKELGKAVQSGLQAVMVYLNYSQPQDAANFRACRGLIFIPLQVQILEVNNVGL